MRSRRLPFLLATALVVTACGSHLSEEEILLANGVRDDATDLGPVATTPADSSPSVDDQAASDQTVQTTPNQPTPNQPTPNQPTPNQPTPNQPSPDQTTPPAGASTGCSTEETGPIVIGSVGNYSGAGGASQANFPRAVRVWATMINDRGGLCGREVQVIVEDDGGDPARYGALVRELVESRNVVAFVGNGAVLSHQGGISYHNSSAVPVFGNDCGSAWYESGVLAPTCPLYPDLLQGMMRSAREISGKKKFGFVYCQEAQACQEGAQLIRQRAPAAGVNLVYEDSVSLAQVDFTAECQAARDAGAEIFTVGADAATGARFAQSCARQQWFPQYLGVNLTFGPDTLDQEGYEDIIVALGTFPFAAASGGAIDEYNQAMDAYAPGIGRSPALSMSWTGAKLFELVATKAAQTDGAITPETLVSALHTVKDETLGGLTVPLSFGPEGTTPAPCYFVIQGDGSGQGYKLPNGPTPKCL